jgi:hypothetical protein
MKIASIGASGGMEIGPRLESPLYLLFHGYNGEIKGKPVDLGLQLDDSPIFPKENYLKLIRYKFSAF